MNSIRPNRNQIKLSGDKILGKTIPDPKNATEMLADHQRMLPSALVNGQRAMTAKTMAKTIPNDRSDGMFTSSGVAAPSVAL